MQNRLTTTLIEFATKSQGKKTEKETRGREREKHRKRDSERKVKGMGEWGVRRRQCNSSNEQRATVAGERKQRHQ